jgi:hypothetical protein
VGQKIVTAGSPELNGMNGKAQELSESVAVAVAVLTIIEDVIPKMNGLVEENIVTISESFSKIATSSKALAKYFELTGTDVKPLIDEINKNISGAIMGMQFQDRLSQNLVILKNISETLNKDLKSAINLQQGENTVASSGINIDLGKKILENLKLGEVREVFINYLINSGLIKNSAELGYTFSEEKKQDDEVELF